MKNNEMWITKTEDSIKGREVWIIKSGETYLPFSARTTKVECIRDHLKWSYFDEWEDLKEAGFQISCVKIRVEEAR